MEILAPCGGPEHIIAAVNCGADAVYVGASKLSARRNAANFTRDELACAVDYCHKNDVKVYLAVNTIVFDEEEDQLLEVLDTARSLAVDALIVQDWGVADFVRRSMPDMPLHASTQTSIHTPAGAVMAAKLGFERVVLARELSAAQINEIIRTGAIDAEVFIHGALCTSVSGQCYFSAMLGSRSGNRGLCAQPCRLDFRCTNHDYALSLKDLSLIERIKELEELGVVSVKIEGRMKRPEYVAAAVTACRAAMAGDKTDMETLGAVFSRSGFTQGYFNADKKAMRGIRRKEDVISATDSLLSGLQRLYAHPVKRGNISMYLRLEEGRPSYLEASVGDESIAVTGEIPQKAERHETTAAEAEKQLCKLKDTPFEINSFHADIETGLMLPLSQLNALRRAVTDRLYRSRIEVNTPKYTHTGEQWKIPKSDIPKAERVIRAECRTKEQWEAARQFGAECSLPLPVIVSLDFKQAPEGLFIALPRWNTGYEAEMTEQLKELKQKGFRHLVCKNIAHLEIGRQLGYICHGSWELNIANERAYTALQKFGMVDAVLSIELSLKQRPRIIPEGRVIYGALPLMLLTRCPVRDTAPDSGCTHCPGLTDRTGRHMELRCDGHGVEVLNSDTLWMADRLSEVQADIFVLLFNKESKDETLVVLNACKYGGNPPVNHTRGLLYRGVE